jgi:hypothetical protein
MGRDCQTNYVPSMTFSNKGGKTPAREVEMDIKCIACRL